MIQNTRLERLVSYTHSSLLGPIHKLQRKKGCKYDPWGLNGPNMIECNNAPDCKDLPVTNTLGYKAQFISYKEKIAVNMALGTYKWAQ